MEKIQCVGCEEDIRKEEEKKKKSKQEKEKKTTLTKISFRFDFFHAPNLLTITIK